MCTTSYCSCAVKDEQLAKANARVTELEDTIEHQNRRHILEADKITQLEEENKRLREVVLFWEYPMVGGNLIKEDIPYKDVRKLFDQLGDALKKDNIPSET